MGLVEGGLRNEHSNVPVCASCQAVVAHLSLGEGVSTASLALGQPKLKRALLSWI